MSISHIQIKSLQHLLNKRQEVAINNILPVGLPDAAAYYYLKQSTFLSKKQQRWIFYFFQGLNTNPQNLSIYVRDEAQRENKNNKQKLIKGVFMIYDLFSQCDMVIQINIPGNLKIYKYLSNGKKQLINNQQIDLMYLSSIFRTMYQINIPWGRYYHLFHDSKNYIQQLKNFYKILFKSCSKKQINIGNQFQSQSNIKGSHSFSLVFKYMQERKLVRHSIQIIQEIIKQNNQYSKCSKICILLAEFYAQFGKPSKSLDIIFLLLNSHPKDPYLLYYQAKYLTQTSHHQQALIILNSIVQYNQFEVWTSLAQIHLQLKNFGHVLICLNHAVKLTKIKGIKNLDIIYKVFEQLGKTRFVGTQQSIQHNPKLLISNDNPLSIMVKQVEQKNKSLIQRGYWKLNSHQKIIYNILQNLRYKIQSKKFQELIMNTFQQSSPKFQPFFIRKGMNQQLSIQDNNIPQKISKNYLSSSIEDQQDQLPDFLKNSMEKVQDSIVPKPSRNLSVIHQIESLIQNSNYEQKQKQKISKGVKLKRQVSEGFYKIVQFILSQTDFQKAEYECNVAKIMNIYNKMRTSSKYNNYYADKMFKIFVQTVSYKSIIVLVADTLDFLQQRGVKKIDKLPYWMHKYIFFIIEQKGLKYLNDMLQKINYYDQAVIDTIEIAKNWKMKGIIY